MLTKLRNLRAIIAEVLRGRDPSGDLTWHRDPRGNHRAIVLRPSGTLGNVDALFLSSNPNWGPGAVRVPEWVLKAVGYQPKRPTYLVPVERPHREFDRPGGKLSKRDVDRLIDVFFPQFDED